MKNARYDPDTYPKRAQELCEAGATCGDLCRAFNVKSRQTIYNWAAKHPEFLKALTSGKEIADDLAEFSLFRRVTGYDYDEVEVTTEQTTVTSVGGECGIQELPAVLKRTKKTKKRVHADVDAAKFWLTNRRPDDWRNRREVSGPDGGPMSVSIQELEELKNLDAKELARLYNTALEQSNAPQLEPQAAGAGGCEIEPGHPVVDQ